MHFDASRAKRLAPWAIAGLSALVAILAVRHAANFTPRLPPATTSRIVVVPAPDVLRAVQSLARLETVSFHFERVMEVHDEQARLWGLVSATDRIVLVAAGEAIGGVDLGAVQPGDITSDWVKRRVAVTLPAPQVLHAALDATRTHVYRRDTDLLATRNEQLETQARAEAQRAMDAAAREAGVIERARENGERSLRTLLGSMGFREIELRWRDRR